MWELPGGMLGQKHREDPVAGWPGYCWPPAPKDAWIPPIAPSTVTTSPLRHSQVTERLSLVLKGKRLNRKCPGQLSPVSQDSRQPSLQKSTRLLRDGRMNPLPSLHCSALCTWPGQPWLLKALPVRFSGVDGASATPSFSQWAKLLRLYGPASLPGFSGRVGGGLSFCHLLPPSLSLVGMPRWNSLTVVNKNPTRKRSLWTEEEKNHTLVGEAYWPVYFLFQPSEGYNWLRGEAIVLGHLVAMTRTEGLMLIVLLPSKPHVQLVN